MALQTKTITANGSKGHHKFTLTVTENSTSVGGNTSSVLWSLEISPIVKGYDWVSNSGKVKYTVAINGKTYTGAIKTYDGKSTVTIKSATATVAHDTDGTKTLSYRFCITDSTGWSFAPGSAEKEGMLELTAIPRQATITAAPDFNDEQNPTVTYANPAGAAVSGLDLCITLDGTTPDSLVSGACLAYKAADPTKTSCTYTLSEADRTFLRNATPDSNTLKVGFCLRTVIGETSYYSTVWCVMTIVNADPTISPTVTETNGNIIALNHGAALVRYYSDAKVTSGAKALKGASITSQSITCGGVTVKSGSGTFSGVKSGNFQFTVKDSRGNITSLGFAVNCVEYEKLTCSIGNSRPDTDGNFTLTASGVCFNGVITGAGSNDLRVLYRYKASGGSYSDWMEMAVTRNANAYTAMASLTGLDYQTTYIFQCKAGDLVDTVTTDQVPVKSVPVFDWSGEDFNFNVPVNAPALNLGGVQLDYIVEQGTKNGWIYRKWNSGIAECWYRAALNTAFASTWGSLYASDNALEPITYPFSFKTAPIETASVNCPNYAAFIYGQNNSGNTTTKTGRYKLARGTASAAAADYTISFAVIGRWK